MADQLDIEVAETSRETSLLNFKKRTLAYISGYVVLKVSRHITCCPCRDALVNSAADPLDPVFASLIRRKSNGALVEPSNSVFQIVLKAEEVFKREIIWKNTASNTANVITALSLKVMRLLDVTSLFPTLNSHVLQQNPAMEEMHSITLVKVIVFRYLKVRCLSYCKVYTSQHKKTQSSRNRNLKVTHFCNE
jgi:hypothetical protein